MSFKISTEMPMEEQQLVEIVDHEAESTIILPEKLLQAARSKPARHMQKVPSLLRQANNQQDYDPFVVSLGPYHHGKKEHQLAEDFKLKTLEIFAAESGKDVPFLYTKVHERINDARSCYIKESTEAYDDETFAQMMLLDACFIINYILIFLKNGYLSTTVWYLGNMAFGMLGHDLCLLENQIPFFILKLLMVLGYGEAEGEEMIRKYVNKVIFGRDKQLQVPMNDSHEEQPLHLLGAFWLLAITKSIEVQPASSCPNSCLIASNDASFLFKDIGNVGLPEEYIHSFRSVSDLKAKGIHFRPGNDGSVNSFKFESGYFCAHLYVPLDYPSKIFKVIYLNLVAFEMCAETPYLPVCDYLEFMKSLLDSPMDVKELREKKILFSSLDSDEEVVRFYKDIKFPIDRVSDTFQNTKDEIEAHYNNKAKTWATEFLHTYFQSPWKAFAFFTGIFLLVLSLLQTFFAIKPRSTK